VIGTKPAAATTTAATSGAPTYAKDVAPIFRARCVQCHHPGTGAPMSLLTFDQVRPWARSIRQRVANREMPPWHLDKTVGIRKYKNDLSLTESEIDTIVR
jgi:mono/diheme cytochrome c family protein